MDIEKGRRLKLSDILPVERRFSVALSLKIPGNTVDFSCFGLDANGRLSDERYMTFFNQPASPCGAVAVNPSGPGDFAFDFDLTRLPVAIERLVLTAAIDGNATMAAALDGSVQLLSEGQSQARFSFSGSDFGSERALMLAEFYRKDGQWRFSATAQGFNGGLEALVKHFGGSVDTPAGAPPASPPPPPPTVSLSKVTLEKRGEKINLDKKSGQAGYGRIVCNLNWKQPAVAEPAKGGFFARLGKRGSGGIDLDLACFVELSSGKKSVVQALGKHFGQFDTEPYVHLLSDDRSGQAADGELVHINGDRLGEIRRVLVFAFIYEGVPNWSSTEARVSINAPGQPEVMVHLDQTSGTASTCAIAEIVNAGGQLQVTKLGEYFNGHKEMDQRYGWGFQWTTGSK